MRTLITAVCAALLAVSGCGGDDPPNPEPVPSTTYTVPVEDGASGDSTVLTSDSGDITPLSVLITANNEIDEAHDGIGNILRHYINDGGSCDADENCIIAWEDARDKVSNACLIIGPDIKGLVTWDKGQTVGHACDAALYWIGVDNLDPESGDVHHAEYQIGILRDVLGAQVKARQHPTLVGFSGGSQGDVTPLGNLKDAAASVEQAHEGLGNVIKNNISGGSPCNYSCDNAIADAGRKNLRAWHEVGDDVLSLVTWDHGQTVGHAFDAANYWLSALNTNARDPNEAHHAEYQLGILRDMLNGEVKKREGNAVGYSGAVTPLASLKDAAAQVEQAHEGLANVRKNDIAGPGGPGCSPECKTALEDAYDKTLDAWHELDGDVLNLRTWDNNQTVGHAFYAAQYWIAQVQVDLRNDEAEHGLYQLGILRDVLNAEVKKREGG